MRYHVGQNLLVTNGTRVELVKIQTIRVKGSKKSYWVKSKEGFEYPINTLDDKIYYYNGEVMVCSVAGLISWIVLLLVLLVLVGTWLV